MSHNLLIASLCQDKLASWKQGLSDFISTISITNSLDILREDVLRVKPQAVLLDYELIGLKDSNDIFSLRKLCEETNIIIVGNISEDLEWEFLKAGIRGCCQSDTEPKLLKQLVLAVQGGELWIRRSLTSRLVEELGKTTFKNKTYQQNLVILNKLTQREYDIAFRVSNGESNKLIALACNITERTVKAHLTEIFIKLGVTDRLNLALFLVANNRVDRADLNIPVNVKSLINKTRLIPTSWKQPQPSAYVSA